MHCVSSSLTVFFEDPFWVGIYQRQCDLSLEAAKIIFGAEPKSYEVYEFLMSHWHDLSFSPTLNCNVKRKNHPNPKRMQRDIKKQLQREFTGTRSQQALALQHQENKIDRKKKRRLRKLEEKDYQFQLHKEKQKQKHRGH